MPQFGGRAGAVWSGGLVFIQRGFRGLDDVRHDAQLLGGAAVQCVRQLGQGEAALAAAVEQQLVRSVHSGRLVVESREDIDVDTTDDGGFALVRVSVEGHSVSGPKRELTITLPDKQYDQLEDVRAKSYSEVGFIMKTSGRVQKIR